MLENFFNIYKLLGGKAKLKMLIMLVLLIVASISEIISIGAVVPYLSFVSNAESIRDRIFIGSISSQFGGYSNIELLTIITILFILVLILSTAIRVYLITFQSKLSAEIASELSNKIFSKIVYQSYENNRKRSSSEIISAVVAKVDTTIYSIILPSFTIITSMIIFLSLLTYLLIIYTNIILLSIVAVITLYSLILVPSRKIVKRSNALTAIERSNQIRIIQETIGSIRDIILDSKQNRYLKIFRESELKLRNSIANVQIIASLPKYIIEMVGTIGILIFINYGVSNKTLNLETLITTVGLLVVSAQRILPLIQQIYHNYTIITANQRSLMDVFEIINELDEGGSSYSSNTNYENPLKFSSNLKLVNLKFSYEGSDEVVLNNINIEINKGEIVGIVGASGCGKSTLIDIMMGLLKPTGGSIILDGVEVDLRNKTWHEKVSHVPQNIFIFDTNLNDNIMQIDDQNQKNSEKLYSVIEAAELQSIQKNKIGENGGKLSGGQRQRIAIARGLYKNFEILFLDEATSALDENTEEKIIKKIFSSSIDKTIIFISHKPNTLKYCNKIYKIENGTNNDPISFIEYMNYTNKSRIK